MKELIDAYGMDVVQAYMSHIQVVCVCVVCVCVRACACVRGASEFAFVNEVKTFHC